MKPEIQKIIDDLYKIDPSLKKKEPELASIIEKLLATKPEAKVDEKFLAELRQEVMTALSAKSMKVNHWENLVSALKNVSRPVYAISGAALALLIVIPLLQTGGSQPQVGSFLADSFGGYETMKVATNIESLGANAFGALGLSGGGADQLEAGAAPSVAVGRGGGGGMLSAPTTVATEAAVMDIGMVSPKMYQPSRFVFDYGNELPSLSGTVEVLKFNTQGNSVSGSLLSQASMGLMDTSRLQGVKTQNINLIEDRDYGYQVNMNFDDNSIHIYQNWQKWPQTSSCNSQGICTSPPRLTEADMPSDQKVIAASDEFLKRMGIDRSGYGQPIIDDRWEKYKTTAESSGEEFWLPDNITVIYPMEVNGVPVFDGGGLSGINVQYSVRHNRVAGAGPIALSSFFGSEYETQTDTDVLTKAIKDGGPNRWYSEEVMKEVHYQLGDPVDCYTLTYSHSSVGKAEKLLVPAWAFPVIRTGDEDDNGYVYYSDYVILPLAKDFYNENNGPIIGQPRPMPLIEPAVMIEKATEELQIMSLPPGIE